MKRRVITLDVIKLNKFDKRIYTIDDICTLPDGEIADYYSRAMSLT